MTQFTEAYDFRGRTLVDPAGEKIGKVDEVYTDREGGQPEWALVHTGLLGTKQSFVPLRAASASGEDVRVTVDKQAVKDAPTVEAGQELSEAEERRLFEHYGVPYTTEGSTTAQGAPGDEYTATGAGAPGGAVGRDVSGPTTDDAMTRS
jgi:PRC-barrel domain